MADNNKPAPAGKGYGGHSKKYWLAVYVVAAIVIYGLIYLLFIRDSGSSGGYSY